MKVFTRLTKSNIEMIPRLIETLRAETNVIPCHDDPGAVEDCWNSLSELCELAIVAAKWKLNRDELERIKSENS